MGVFCLTTSALDPVCFTYNSAIVTDAKQRARGRVSGDAGCAANEASTQERDALRIDGLDKNKPIEDVIENTGSQVDRFGFIRGTFDVQHASVPDGAVVSHTVSATWNLSEVDRDRQSPPPGERR